MANITKSPKFKPVTLEEMEIAIAEHYNYNKCLTIPNVKWGFEIHECDLLIMRPSGYLIEIEIKRSIADLKNDAKKRHGHKDRKNRIKEFYFAIPSELYEKSLPHINDGAGIITVHKWEEGYARARVKRNADPDRSVRKLTIYEMYQLARLGALRIWRLKEKVNKKNLNRKQFTDAVRTGTRGRLMKLNAEEKALRIKDWRSDRAIEIYHDIILIESIRDDMIRSLK